jgi:hypothetical protein
MNSLQITARPGWAVKRRFRSRMSSEIDQRKDSAHPRSSRGRSASPTRLDASQAADEHSNARIGEQDESANCLPVVVVDKLKPPTRTVRYPVDIFNSIRQIRDRSAAPCGNVSHSRMTKMRLNDRDELSAQIRDYDTCFAEFLKPSGNGQKILQAILLREAFSLLAQRGIAIRQDAPTVILDVSCGPGDYSVAWT